MLLNEEIGRDWWRMVWNGGEWCGKVEKNGKLLGMVRNCV